MKKREFAELRKAVKAVEDTCIQKVIVCYASKNDEGLSEPKETKFYMLDEELAVKILDKSKKALSGKVGKNQVELHAQSKDVPVANGAFRNLLKEQTEESAAEVCRQIAENFVSETDYCILILFGTYDVPHKKSEGGDFIDGDIVYQFMQVMMLPASMSKPGLAFDNASKEVVNRELFREIGDPTAAFLYPAFTDRAPDPDSVAMFCKKPNYYQDDLVRNLLFAEVPSTPDVQQTCFKNMLTTVVGEKGSFPVMVGVCEWLTEQLEKDPLDPEVVSVHTKELKEKVKELAVENNVDFDEHRLNKMLEDEPKDLLVKNILAEKIDLSTTHADIRISAEDIGRIEKRRIDGKNVFVIPEDGFSSLFDIKC